MTRWGAFWRGVVRFQAGKVNPQLAVRNTLGVVLPLAICAAAGSIATGVAVSTGALNVCFSDGQEPYRQRARRMLAASVMVALAVFAGSLSGGNDAVAVVVAAAWAFQAGMLVALSAPAADVGAMSLFTLLVYAAVPMTPERAALAGALAFAGGLLQTALALLFWPLQRYVPERRALADLYVELGRIAGRPVEARQAPPASAFITQAQQLLAELNRDRSLEGERYRMLLSQAERIRLRLLVLGRLRIRLEREAPLCPARRILDRFLEACSHVLDSVGESLSAGKPAAVAAEMQEFRELPDGLRTPAPDDPPAIRAVLRDAQLQVDALGGQLRTAVDLAVHQTPAG